MKWFELYRDKLDDILYSKMKDQSEVASSSNSTDLYPVLIKVGKNSASKKLAEIVDLSEGDEQGQRIPNMNYMAGKLSEQTLAKLAQSGEIQKVHYDRKVKVNLDVATPSVGGTYAKNSFGLTGKNVTIAVLDTGIYNHPDFLYPSNRIINFKDFVNGRLSPYDDNGHGTHVAGCAAGNGIAIGGKYASPAPDALIVAVKVLDINGSGFLSTIIAGIDYVIQNKTRFNIKIMNLSLGGDPYTTYSEDPLAEAAASAVGAGIIVFAAAGNSGPTGTIDSPGIHPKVVTVGAIDDRNTTVITDDIKASYTSKAPTIDGLIKPDFYVPGTNIIAPIAPGSQIALQNPGGVLSGNYMALSGTSMATPIAAGMAAVILQAYPTFTPEKLKLTMLQSMQMFGGTREGYLLLQQVFKLLLS